MAQQISQATAYASLLLHDCGLPITAANLLAVLKGAKVTGNDQVYRVFEETLKTVPITNFIGSVGSGAPAGAPAAASSAPAKKAEEPKKVEEPKEDEADMDMGDLFG